MPDCITAVIYDRLSPKPVRKEPTEAQLAAIEEERRQVAYRQQACQEYCAFKKYEVCKVIFDEFSGRITRLADRTGGAELLEITRGRKIKNIVAYKLERLFRSTADGLATIDTWSAAGITVHLASESGQSVNTGTAFGKMIVTTRLMLAEFEAGNGAERTSDAMRRHVDAGRMMGGTAKYGWELDPDRPGRTRANPVEQETLATMLRLYDELGTAARVATALNKQGCFNRRGRPWHHEAVRRILGRPLVAT